MALVKRSSDTALVKTRIPSAVVAAGSPASSAVLDECGAAYRRLGKRAMGLAVQALDLQVAEDVVGDVFESFVRRWPDLAPNERSDGAIMAAVRNSIISQIRHEATIEFVELTAQMANDGRVPALPPVVPGEVVEDASAVDYIVEQLSPRCREAYRLCRDDGMTYTEAARVMGISRESVKTHLKRANGLIEDALTHAGYRLEEGRVVQALPRSTALMIEREGSHE